MRDWLSILIDSIRRIQCVVNVCVGVGRRLESSKGCGSVERTNTLAFEHKVPLPIIARASLLSSRLTHSTWLHRHRRRGARHVGAALRTVGLSLVPVVLLLRSTLYVQLRVACVASRRLIRTGPPTRCE